MQYFVFSSKVEQGCPIALAEEAHLYDKFYGNTQSVPEYGFFPWYNYKTSENCLLPINGCLISKAEFYDFDIRNISSSIYIASNLFIHIANELGICFLDIQPITIRSKEGYFISNKEYFIVRLKKERFEDVVNIEESKFEFEFPHYTLEKAVIKKSCELPIFLIENITPIQNTLFCSEFFLKFSQKYDLKGINFFKCEEAPWQNPNNFLNFLHHDNYDLNKEVWAI